MKREDLTKLGLTDDAVIDAIMAAHGKDIEKHKNAADASKAELESIKTQLTEANTQIEGFKSMDIEAVKKAATDWEAKAKQAEADAATQLAKVKFDHALESSLTGAKAKNVKAVQALLNTETLKLKDDGTIEGLDDQLKEIKSKNDYLFADEKVTPKIVTSTNNKSVIGDATVDAARKAAGLPIAAAEQKQ